MSEIETATSRDQLMTDPKLVEIVTAEALRISCALYLDRMNSKEIYRSMIAVTVQVAAELIATHEKAIAASLSREAALVEVLKQFIDAYDNHAVELNSPTIDIDNHPSHQWHEEWLSRSRALITN